MNNKIQNIHESIASLLMLANFVVSKFFVLKFEEEKMKMGSASAWQIMGLIGVDFLYIDNFCKISEILSLFHMPFMLKMH